MPTSARTTSGRDRPMTSIARSPSLTAMTLTSSVANVSSTTRWIVRLRSASRTVFGTLMVSVDAGAGRSSGAGPDIFGDECDDVLHRGAGQKHAFHAKGVKPLH